MGTGPLVPGLLPQKPGQCILMLGASLSFFGSGANTDRSDFSGPVTLLERLYLRAVTHLSTMHADSDRDLYMSNVTVQGGVSIEEGPPDGAGGIRLQGALYAEGACWSVPVPVPVVSWCHKPDASEVLCSVLLKKPPALCRQIVNHVSNPCNHQRCAAPCRHAPAHNAMHRPHRPLRSRHIIYTTWICAGTTFSDLVPDDMHPYVISASDSVSLYDCAFENNHVHSPAGALIVSSLHGRARLEHCTYTSNAVSQDMFDNNEHDPSVFYSDEPRSVGFLLGNSVVTSPLEEAGEGFMAADDVRVAAIRAVRPSAVLCVDIDVPFLRKSGVAAGQLPLKWTAGLYGEFQSPGMQCPVVCGCMRALNHVAVLEALSSGRVLGSLALCTRLAELPLILRVPRVLWCQHKS